MPHEIEKCEVIRYRHLFILPSAVLSLEAAFCMNVGDESHSLLPLKSFSILPGFATSNPAICLVSLLNASLMVVICKLKVMLMGASIRHF